MTSPAFAALAVSVSIPMFVAIVASSAIVGGLIVALIILIRFRHHFDLLGEVSELRNIIAFLQSEAVRRDADTKASDETISGLKTENSHLQGVIEALHYNMEMLSTKVEIDAKTSGYHLLAVVGSGTATRDDLLSLRQSGVDVNLSHPPTLDAFEKRLNYLRANGTLPRGLHFGLHANSSGVQFEDTLASIDWLSENISDVETVLISGCEGAEIGFALGGVKQRIITVQNKIGADHANLLTKIFWEQIASGKNATSAYAETKRRLPPGVAELLEIH